MLFSLFFLFPIFLGLIFYFRVKLVYLILLELCSVFFIFFFYTSFDVWVTIFSLVFIFLVFMVVESVFGICLLIINSRQSSYISPSFESF